TTCPGSVRPKCDSAIVPLHAPTTNTRTMMAACMSGDDGISSQSARPAAEPKVPGANGTWPTPPTVAMKSALLRIKPRRGRRGCGAGDCDALGEPAPVPAKEREKAEPGGDGEQHPEDRARPRAADVERASRFGGDHANAGRHLSERLAACREGHEVAAVLHE